jgi:putative exporter of polyketide antibiotics
VNKIRLHKTLTVLIAFVWLVNGLYCKVLGFVPRHEHIVKRILYSPFFPEYFTKIIGLAEILMGLWILSGIKKRWNTVAQIVIVGTMNILEFMLVPDLLLWGTMNIVFAFVFILLVYFNEFYCREKNI